MERALWLVAMIGCVVGEPGDAERAGPPICVAPDCGCRDEDGDCGPVRCAGILGLGCGPGQECVDDPRDDCDPRDGGSDCWGLCVVVEAPAPLDLAAAVPGRCDIPGRTYVSHDPALCAEVLFLCAPRWLPFYDACGCGCVRP